MNGTFFCTNFRTYIVLESNLFSIYKMQTKSEKYPQLDLTQLKSLKSYIIMIMM